MKKTISEMVEGSNYRILVKDGDTSFTYEGEYVGKDLLVSTFVFKLIPGFFHYFNVINILSVELIEK